MVVPTQRFLFNSCYFDVDNVGLPEQIYFLESFGIVRKTSSEVSLCSGSSFITMTSDSFVDAIIEGSIKVVPFGKEGNQWKRPTSFFRATFSDNFISLFTDDTTLGQGISTRANESAWVR